MAKIVIILALIAAVFCNGNIVHGVTPKDTQYICSLPLETGPCRASIRRYGFNSTSKQCENFTYGGCKGNANNFETINDCEATCPGKQ